VSYNFSQNIQDNVEEAMSGVKGENSLKLFGENLGKLEATAHQIERVMQTIPGVADLSVFGGSVAKFDFWAKSKNLVSGIQ